MGLWVGAVRVRGFLSDDLRQPEQLVLRRSRAQGESGPAPTGRRKSTGGIF